MDINLYTTGLDAGLIPLIKKRLLDFDMDCDFHPEFRFDENNDSGFCPIKMNVLDNRAAHYKKFGKTVLTGFELFFDNYNYENQLTELYEYPVKRSFLSKTFRPKSKIELKEQVVDNIILDEKLKRCDKEIMLNWKSYNKSELRISLYFVALLAEITDGVIYDPQTGEYLYGKTALQTYPNEITEFENSIPYDDFQLVEFENWD